MNDIKKLSLSVVKDELDVSEMVEIQAGSGCGGDVASCMGAAYSSYGWVSVWMWVQSAFIPETVAAVALTCAAYNC